MTETNMLLIEFSKKEIPQILDTYGKKVDESGYIIDMGTGHPQDCFACGEKIKAGKLGNIMPGSDAFLCDKVSCFARYVVNEDIV